ncbi:MAG: DsbA family oxidoreductase [Halobacteriota archaeon]|uniref:DsbA family oxidoreductase n=1 Tax=Natronomonas sp. TaxID=2184060 RepID=UPI0039765F09
MRSASPTITIYSDYVCPFCYLGRISLDRYQDTRDEKLRIDWHPFDLRSQKRRPDGTIDHAVDDGKDDDYFEQAKRNVRRLAEKYDAEMDLELATDIDSLSAQLVSYYLRENRDYETWLAFDEAVLAALWEDGKDIGKPALLVELATDAGADADEVRSALDDDSLREELRQRFTDAQSEGIGGVPTFAYDGYAARGAVPPEQLERLVEGV